MSNVVNAPGQVGPSVPDASSGRTAPTESRFRGERVQHVRNPTAELQDAAEELTFGESERVEKKISKRKLRSGDAARSVAMEQARKYLREVPDLERNQKLSEFVKSVLARSRSPGPDELRQFAREFSDDSTHQFLALVSAREQAVEHNAGPALGAALDEAIATLQGESGPAIQAGLNVSAVAQQFAGKDIGDIQQLRDFYREVVLDCEDLNDAYRRVLDDHPGKRFDAAVHFMLKALGADLGAVTQTVSSARLVRIMDDMYQLKSLISVHEQCDDLIRRVQRNFDATPDATALRDLMSELLTAQNRAWQGAGAFSQLPGKMGVRGDEAAIYLLQGFKELVRGMPLKAFGDDMTKRDRVMTSVQQAIDLCIDNEDLGD